MASRMLKFTTIDRTMPEKREARARTSDFHEIYADYAQTVAEDQASRCSQCGVPFCQQGCPLTNNIPDWLKLVAEDRMEEAYQVSQATNNMPEICGRICPQDRLCEGICTVEQSGHGTVTIGAIERYITDNAWEQGYVTPIKPPRERDQSAGIIGAGPGDSPLPNSFAARAIRSPSMTAMTAAAGFWSMAFQVSSWRNTSSNAASSGLRTVASHSSSTPRSAKASPSAICATAMTPS